MTHHTKPCGQILRIGLLLPVLLIMNPTQAQNPACTAYSNLALVNGVIHTMDTADTVVSSVHIIDSRIISAGNSPSATTDCTTTIDLQARTVVPGLIDNHNHIVLLGLRPGHDTRLENATSISEVLATINARAEGIPEGGWLTAIGGFDISQFVPPSGVYSARLCRARH